MLSRLAGWGRFPVVEAIERCSEDLESSTRGASLSRGLGRSYGDSSLPLPGAVAACTRLADRVLAFDEATGVLRAEAGVTLARLNERLLPRGWFTPVSPGTQQVTVGGMVASDVHGKNHHVAGCFGAHVRALRLRVADGRILEIGPQAEPELFRATLGGMGLTGHLLEVEFVLERVPSPWIVEETDPARDLDELVGKLRESSRSWPFTAAWADGLAPGARRGRGAVIRGRWASPEEAPAHRPSPPRAPGVPLDMPEWLLTRPAVRAFNALYYRRQRARRRVVSPYGFFYPLDVLSDWNRLYGKRGFTQYQCVIPDATAAAGSRRLFDALSRLDGAPFLIVVKDCGPEGSGMISFPLRGISLALDLPIDGAHTQRLVDALNEIVIDCGGRVYLTKDALTRREHFQAMDPRLAAWNAVRRRWDPDLRIASLQSRRLLGDAA